MIATTINVVSKIESLFFFLIAIGFLTGSKENYFQRRLLQNTVYVHCILYFTYYVNLETDYY